MGPVCGDLDHDMNDQKEKRAERNGTVYCLGNNSRSRNHDNAIGSHNSHADRGR